MFAPRFPRVSRPLVMVALLVFGLTYGIVRSQDNNTQAAKDANATLQAVGGLGVGHIQSSLGLIGVTADAFAKEVYTAKQVEDLMNGTINGIEAVKKLLRRLQETPVGRRQGIHRPDGQRVQRAAARGQVAGRVCQVEETGRCGTLRCGPQVRRVKAGTTDRRKQGRTRGGAGR